MQLQCVLLVWLVFICLLQIQSLDLGLVGIRGI